MNVDFVDDKANSDSDGCTTMFWLSILLTILEYNGISLPVSFSLPAELETTSLLKSLRIALSASKSLFLSSSFNCLLFPITDRRILIPSE